MKRNTCIIFLLLVGILPLACQSSAPSGGGQPLPSVPVQKQQELNREELAKKLAAVTISDLTATNLVTDDAWNDTPFPLLAQLPDADIALYGYHVEKNYTGVILRTGDHLQTFLWDYTTPRQILPQMQLFDYDQDGIEELGVILYTDSGTGYAIEALHILEPEPVKTKDAAMKAEKNGETKSATAVHYLDYCFTPQDYLQQIKEHITCQYQSAAHTVTFITQNHSKVFDCSTWFPPDSLEEIIYGHLVSFTFHPINKQPEILFAPAFLITDTEEPQYYTDYFRASIQYQDNQFTLTQFDLN